MLLSCRSLNRKNKSIICLQAIEMSLNVNHHSQPVKMFLLESNGQDTTNCRSEESPDPRSAVGFGSGFVRLSRLPVYLCLWSISSNPQTSLSSNRLTDYSLSFSLSLSIADLRSLAPPTPPHIWQLCIALTLVLIGRLRWPPPPPEQPRPLTSPVASPRKRLTAGFELSNPACTTMPLPTTLYPTPPHPPTPLPTTHWPPSNQRYTCERGNREKRSYNPSLATVLEGRGNYKTQIQDGWL